MMCSSVSINFSFLLLPFLGSLCVATMIPRPLPLLRSTSVSSSKPGLADMQAWWMGRSPSLSMAFGWAPASKSLMAALVSPLFKAVCSKVSPFLLQTSMSAPLLESKSNRFSSFVGPFSVTATFLNLKSTMAPLSAQCNGKLPSSSEMLTSAPFSIKNRTSLGKPSTVHDLKLPGRTTTSPAFMCSTFCLAALVLKTPWILSAALPSSTSSSGGTPSQLVTAFNVSYTTSEMSAGSRFPLTLWMREGGTSTTSSVSSSKTPSPSSLFIGLPYSLSVISPSVSSPPTVLVSGTSSTSSLTSPTSTAGGSSFFSSPSTSSAAGGVSVICIVSTRFMVPSTSLSSPSVMTPVVS
mmetsp:Transcript_27528/g.52184  ORF Transcript_27528/g.52184 Transcript_27528/m.52184 type:complete len:351 (-) Transcript_27528:977-2029(-)